MSKLAVETIAGLSVKQKETIRIAVGVAIGNVEFIKKPFSFSVTMWEGQWHTSVVSGCVEDEGQDVGNSQN